MRNNWRRFTALWLFFRKLILPSLSMSVLLAIIYSGSIAVNKTIGISFLFLPLFFHYIIYESTSPGEYYFYYNLGWSKPALWMNTIILSMTIGLFVFVL